MEFHIFAAYGAIRMVLAERFEMICSDMSKDLGEPLQTACVLVMTPFSLGSITYNI